MSRKKRFKTRGLNIAERAMMMAKSIRGEDVGGKRWEIGTHRGLTKWEYWMEIISPALNYIKMEPTLNSEQKMLATKEFLKWFRDAFPDFVMSGVGRAVSLSRTVIPVRAASPEVIVPPELIV
jgi:hypothetical protein